MTDRTPRTLADQLRGWSDDQLAGLLRARPDLAAPTPQDSSQLASRVGTRASVVRAVDHLDLLSLAVIDAAVALGGEPSLSVLQQHLNATSASVAGAVDRLLSVALLWGTRDRLRLLSAAHDVVGTAVSGLGASAEALLAGYGPQRVADLARDLGVNPSGDKQSDVAAVAAHLAVRAHVDALVAELDAPARALLEHLDEHGPDGTVEGADRPVTRTTASSPVEQLLARGLVVARDRAHVSLPREVAVCLRGGSTTRFPVDEVPALATSDRDPALVDRAAAGAAFEFVRHVELLLEHWGTAPPASLRGGGLGVRDLRAAAELLHTDERGAALHVEVAFAAGLLAVGMTEDHDAAWLPTDAFDVWNAGSVADRWTRLALAWLDSPRLSALVGSRDENRKPVNALVPDLERGWLAETRRVMLVELADLPAGAVLAAGTGTASLVERLRWLHPRRPAQRAEAVGWLLEEAALLGVTGLGGMPAHGRALVADEDPTHRAAAALEPLLPQPVDHVLLQADLTAVAPGPLEHELAHGLATMADIESRGGATVYRFTATSVRRAFDAGWSAAEIHDFLATSSRTPVPQALDYLVDDVARRFGTLRVGAAESFLRSDDEAALTELVHNPKAASLRLRRIAPTVAVSDVPLDVLLPRLRELGSAPVVEAPDGTVRMARKDVHRARTPRHRPADAAAHARESAHIARTVRAIRSGDRVATERPHRARVGGSPAAVLAALREAAETTSTVTIGYVDNQGATVERIVDPVRVHAGQLTAYDHRSEEVRLFAVHRITDVSTSPR